MMALGPQEAAVGNGSSRTQRDHSIVPAPHFSPERAGIPTTFCSTLGTGAPDHALTVIVPAFNEQQRLPSTLDGLGAYLDRWGVDYRVLVVDDGSHDRTAVQSAGRGPRFATISQPNRGKGAAVRLGMLNATGRLVAFTDADLPYDLDAVKVAYSLLNDGVCDVVFGARDLDDSVALAPRRLLRTIAHVAFSNVVRRLVSRQITDTQCGLKLFTREAAHEIFTRTTLDGFAFDAEVVLLTHFLGLSFRRVPVTLINEYASTISLSRHALPMLQDVLRVKLRAWRGEYAPPGEIPLPLEAPQATTPVCTAA